MFSVHTFARFGKVTSLNVTFICKGLLEMKFNFNTALLFRHVYDMMSTFLQHFKINMKCTSSHFSN